MAKLEFWFDFASPYSYLSAARVDDLCAAAGIETVWRPFLLGPIFQSQGWTTSPFNLYPAKGRYMVRDIARLASDRGLPFAMPEIFPAHSVLAARLALACDMLVDNRMCARVSRAVFEAQFTGGRDISKQTVLSDVVRSCDLDPDAINAAIDSAEAKDLLRRQTALAQERGIFGAPTFIAPDGELFWGDDRLEQAITWSCARRD
jgi:2-hydroxychromene-2-carboxylate isomerase